MTRGTDTSFVLSIIPEGIESSLFKYGMDKNEKRAASAKVTFSRFDNNTCWVLPRLLSLSYVKNHPNPLPANLNIFQAIISKTASGR